ncbi:MAG TPA: ankyrin repeat domain-containing protein [Streptosporangiaceae bacterium]
MGQELHHELRAKQAGQYRDEAKSLLRAVRAADAAAAQRAREVLGDRVARRFVLADALHVLALEHGYRSWPAFKHAVEKQGPTTRPLYRVGAFGHEEYEGWAGRLLAAARGGDADALLRLRQRVPRLSGEDDQNIAGQATQADARIALAREYGFRTWGELAAATDRARDTHYSRLPPELPWKRAEAAIWAGDAETLRSLLEQHTGLESEDPGETLLSVAAQPEAGPVPREVVDLLIESGSALDNPLSIAACFNKADLVGWLLDAGADPAAAPGVLALPSAAYHGSREAADVLVSRAGIIPDLFYLACAAGDIAWMERWFDAAGHLLPQALSERPDFSDVGWPGRAIRPDPDDAIAEGLALAAHLGRTQACGWLLDRGADLASGPLYGLTPLHFAASAGRHDTASLLVSRGAPLGARNRLHDGTPLGWAQHHGHKDPRLLRLLGAATPS